MRKAAIDLGTNTCLLLIAECDAQTGKVLEELKDFSTVVRLGEGVDQSKVLQPAAMERTLECLQKYVLAVQQAGLRPTEVQCVATSQARDAQNGQEFFSRVEKETGLKFRILSGDQEAELTFLGGLLPDLDPEQTAVIDIGGGSTEYIHKHGKISLDLGSVRFTERYLLSDPQIPVTDDQFWSCQAAIDQQIKKLLPWRESFGSEEMMLLAVAGTATTLASWFLNQDAFDPLSINKVILTRGDVHRMVEELKWRSPAERRKLVGIEPKRADVLLAGALILWRSMELLNLPECRVSTRGLRYGILFN